MRNAILLIILLLAPCNQVIGARNPIDLESPDVQIRIYQEAVKAHPEDINRYNQLAYAYIKKVRATADPSYGILAEKLLKQALAIDDKNCDSLVYLGLVQMSQHRFSDAKATALKAITENLEDSTAYGVLGDATFELGLYQDCADAYQKMVDLRPSTASYSRAAYYRKLVGDLDGATELMKRAFALADAHDPENRAWCLLQLGHLAFASGKIEQAEQYYSYALEIFPNFYNALAALARAKAALGQTEEAITLYNRAIAIVPMPEFVSNLGDLYTMLARSEEAKRQYDLVEYIGLISQINKEIYNRQLALFYADHHLKLDQALQLARSELEIRKDIYGYDALAWCLYRNGKYDEAAQSIGEALKMGTQDALLFFHAGMIFSKVNQMQEAKKYLQLALSTNPHFHPLFAKVAEDAIAGMKP